MPNLAFQPTPPARLNFDDREGLMRDLARIDQVLSLLREVWELEPDLRLGQLIFNAARIRQPSIDDVFSIEESDLCQGLERYREMMIENKRDNAKL
jgi:uncharacterized protein YihD (DUF1040 family)